MVGINLEDGVGGLVLLCCKIEVVKVVVVWVGVDFFVNVCCDVWFKCLVFGCEVDEVLLWVCDYVVVGVDGLFVVGVMMLVDI